MVSVGARCPADTFNGQNVHALLFSSGSASFDILNSFSHNPSEMNPESAGSYFCMNQVSADRM